MLNKLQSFPEQLRKYSEKQLAWVELSAAVITELLLTKLFSFKASSTTFAQAAVLYLIVQRSISYLD